MKLVPMTKGSDIRDREQAVPRNEVCTLRLSRRETQAQCRPGRHQQGRENGLQVRRGPDEGCGSGDKEVETEQQLLKR